MQNLNKNFKHNIKQFLKSENLESGKLLNKKLSFDNNKFVSVLDYTNYIYINNMEEDFKVAFKKSGYKGINLGITSLWNNNEKKTFFNNIGIDVISFHGTSLKVSMKNNIEYKQALINDLNVLKFLGIHNTTINYDLYAGHLDTDCYTKSFIKSQNNNCEMLCKKLNIESPTIESLLEYIIIEIDNIYNESNYTICLEIPGSKGWSMLPEITNKSLSNIVKVIKKCKTTMKICIDIGHIFTWGYKATKLKEILHLLDLYKEYIGMLHISSASSNNTYFLNAYNLIYGNKYPTWHKKGLDLQMIISDKKMLNFLSELRIILKKQKIIEVSEIRPVSYAIKDYFSDEDLDFIDDKNYFNYMVLQSIILGYSL